MAAAGWSDDDMPLDYRFGVEAEATLIYLSDFGADNVTAFPQSIGMGHTWNTSLEKAKGNVIGVELRSIAAANWARGFVRN